WRLIALQHVFGFGVAQKRDALRKGRGGAETGEEKDGGKDKARKKGQTASLAGGPMPWRKGPWNRVDTRHDDSLHEPPFTPKLGGRANKVKSHALPRRRCSGITGLRLIFGLRDFYA